MRVIVVAGVFAVSLFAAGCKQEKQAPRTVRPVLSTVVQADKVERHHSCGHRGTAVQD